MTEVEQVATIYVPDPTSRSGWSLHDCPADEPERPPMGFRIRD